MDRDCETVGELLELWRVRRADAWILVHEVAGSVACGAGRAPDADDLAAEATLRALEENAAALRRADPSTRLATWLWGVVRNIDREATRTTRPSRAQAAKRARSSSTSRR